MQDHSLRSKSVEPLSSSATKFTQYQKRAFTFLEQWNEDKWAFKVYGITHQAEHSRGHALNSKMVAAARIQIRAHLPEVDRMDDHYHTGFIIVHQALGENWLLLHWWIQEAICCESLWKSHEESPTEFKAVQRPFMACVWELVVIDFERRAWVDAVLQRETNLEHYLANRLPNGSY